MADFVPPAGPPPPRVPEGWKAQWNDQYKEWFYVNLYTKKSQWDKPTEPAYGPPDGAAPAGPPPGYDHGSSSHVVGNEKSGLHSNNPFGSGAGGMTEDERLARKLQEEENSRAGGSTRGAADDFYQGQQPGASSHPQQSSYGASASPYGQQDLPARDQKKGGFLSKLMGKASSSGRPQGYGGGYPQQQQQQYYQQGPPQGQYGGGYPPQQQPYYGQQQYGQQQQYYQQQPQRKQGMGAGTGAALGVGGGLLGGMLLMDAMDDHQDQQAYDQGYDQGYDNGDDGGGDMGGDDGGGGDF